MRSIAVPWCLLSGEPNRRRAGLDGRLMKLEEKHGRKICDGDRVECQSASLARRRLDDPLYEGWKRVESNRQFNCAAGLEAGQRTGEQKFIDHLTKNSCFLDQFLPMIFRHKDSQNVDARYIRSWH
jgi:hypothetical protein